MRRENNGFFVIHRQIKDWRWWHNNTARGIWFYLLAEANWKDGWFMGERVPRGSLATSTASLAEQTGVSESTVRRWLKKFENDGQITRQATNRFTIINITNYRAFQDIPDDRVNEQMTEQVNKQMNEQVNNQVTEQVNHNRTKKQSNKETKKQYLSLRARPEREEVESYIFEKNLSVNADDFLLYYNENDWTGSDGEPLKSWKSALISWNKKEKKKTEQKKGLSFYDIE